MTKTKAGLARIAEFARPRVSTAWRSKPRAVVASLTLGLGLGSVLVGAWGRWGPLVVGLVLVGLAVGLAILDELLTPHEVPRGVSELKVEEK